MTSCIIISISLFGIWLTTIIFARMQSLSDIKPVLRADRIIANHNNSAVIVRISNNGSATRILHIKALTANVEVVSQNLPQDIGDGENFIITLLYHKATECLHNECIRLHIRHSDIEGNIHNNKIICPIRKTDTE